MKKSSPLLTTLLSLFICPAFYAAYYDGSELIFIKNDRIYFINPDQSFDPKLPEEYSFESFQFNQFIAHTTKKNQKIFPQDTYLPDIEPNGNPSVCEKKIIWEKTSVSKFEKPSMENFQLFKGIKWKK